MIKKLPTLFFTFAAVLASTASLWFVTLPKHTIPHTLSGAGGFYLAENSPGTSLQFSASVTDIQSPVENHHLAEHTTYSGQNLEKLVRFLRQIEVARWCHTGRDNILPRISLFHVWSIWNPSIPIALRKLLI